MLTYKFVPSDCKGKKPTLSGHVLLRCPTADELLENFAEMNLEISSEGEVDLSSTAQMSAISKIAKKASSYCEKVEIKILEDGTELKSYEEFATYPETRAAYFEMAAKLMNGMRPSKN